MSDKASNLSSATFTWRAFAIPSGVKLSERGPLTVEIETNEHLDQVLQFFFDVYTTLLTTRDVYRFRNDPE